ncbi:MAG TPA: dihydroxy-acid dehydratase [Paraburkholderia sp.]|jgi:dihydroxyacid dehydratase/phosphogluconate dehydratase|nr:dihydroxy-acid dehydratase [Paraburkholderia sp.]
MEHTGRAVVFENAEDLAHRIDADDLDVSADDIPVLKDIGPKGAPGMPEAGYIAQESNRRMPADRRAALFIPAVNCRAFRA